MRERTIASHFARAALGGAQRRGYDYSKLLQQLGISPELLDEPRARIPPEQFTRLVQALWLALDDEYLGFGRGISKPGSFAMMCHAVIHCRNLDKALHRGLLFYSLFPDAPRLTLTREDEMIRLSLDDSQLWDPEHFLTESLLVIWHRFPSWLIGQRIRLEHATFSYPRPDHGAEYELLFSCPLEFSAQQSSLLFHARYLDMPLLQDERTLKQFLERSPADLLSRPDDGHSLSSQLRRLLSSDRSPWPDLEAVAAHLHISPQTLRRHLREEKHQFSGVEGPTAQGYCHLSPGPQRPALATDRRATGLFRAIGVSSGVQEVDRADARGLSGSGKLSSTGNYRRSHRREMNTESRPPKG